MFWATTCPSSGADGCVMLSPCVGMCRGCREVVKSGWQVVRPWMGDNFTQSSASDDGHVVARNMLSDY